ncbi:MAG TPA: bifunctional oligoribonuclease/PAP phosphatase NrnA [Salinivirgaceae bacterium]|nr:bifunctional oligoribonuclease/PAP phosphatase NrnA [Salinivirgaceae bacterium]
MNTLDHVKLSRLSDLLAKTKRAAVFTHVNPDGDALGSGLALVSLFKAMGIESRLIIPNTVPSNLKWLPNYDNVWEAPSVETVADWLEYTHTIFLVDFNQYSRIAPYDPLVRGSRVPVVLIDHHQQPQIDAQLVFSEIEVSSTAELCHQIFKNLFQTYFSLDYATCIYSGIVTDTGSFSYNSSWDHTFECVAELIRMGINKDQITSMIFKNNTENRLRLLGQILTNGMEVLPEYHTAYMTLSLEDQKRFDYQEGDSENFVNYPLSIKDIRFSAFFHEKPDEIKISLRSEGDFSVNTIARRYFNGGGHKNAAGGRSFKSLNETIQDFLTILRNHAHEI